MQVNSSSFNGDMGEYGGGKAFQLLAFIGRDIEYWNWGIMLQLYRMLVRPHRLLCAVLVNTVKKACGTTRKSAEINDLHVAWNTRLWLTGEIE